MQIRQFIQYFEENTTIIVRGQKSNPDGTKKFIDLINMKLKDLIEIFGYYNSILDKNINFGQVTVIDSKVIIIIPE